MLSSDDEMGRIPCPCPLAILLLYSGSKANEQGKIQHVHCPLSFSPDHILCVHVGVLKAQRIIDRSCTVLSPTMGSAYSHHVPSSCYDGPYTCTCVLQTRLGSCMYMYIYTVHVHVGQ